MTAILTESERHTVFWRTLLWPGMERSTRIRTEHGENRLEGTAIVLDDVTPFELSYWIATDTKWQTRRVSVTVMQNNDPVREIVIEADEDRRWFFDGTESPNVEGCIDIDLGFSPVTNLLPIQRLSLDVGERSPVRAAWLRFPELVLEPLDQHYIRTNKNTYRYESTAGQHRLISLDDHGMVCSYEGGWERLR